jgi:hypothetical protein
MAKPNTALAAHPQSLISPESGASAEIVLGFATLSTNLLDTAA